MFPNKSALILASLKHEGALGASQDPQPVALAGKPRMPGTDQTAEKGEKGSAFYWKSWSLNRTI